MCEGEGTPAHRSISLARCAVHQASEREDGAEKFEAYARRAALLAEADELRAKVCVRGGKGEVWVEEEGDGSAAGIFCGQAGMAHLL